MNEEPAIVRPSRSASLDFAVVGIGASAGGLRALSGLFKNMPSDSGMSFVVIVHLSPEYESNIPHLLQQNTGMPVTAVTETVGIEPNHIYVISPRMELRMQDGTVEPSKSRPHGAMTIDVFFETLAEAHNEHAVGIVLSGTGSDGTRGIRAIKAHGGITFAQQPEEAEYDSMPRNAMASGDVDFALPVAEIPSKLIALRQSARAIRIPPLPEKVSPKDATAEAEDALRDIAATLRARTGHDFSQYKRATMVRRIERRMQVNEVRSLDDYSHFLASHPGEAQALLRDLLISVTWFFRDPGAFKAIEQRVLPDLFAGRNGEQIRIWVVGCSSGEEAYSLAMLYQEYAEGHSDAPELSLFATDIDEEALAVARAGVYPESISDNVSPERLRKFFVREQGAYRINRQIRDKVMFAVHNVIQDPPFSRLDLVSCRNLLIYLNRNVQSKVLDLLHFSLRSDGFLLLGMSESVEDGHDGFIVVDKMHRIFAQQPRARAGLLLSALPLLYPTRSTNPADAAARRLVSYPELHQRLLEHYASPSVIVDDHYDVVHLSDHAGHFLQFAAGEASLNLLKIAPEGMRYELKAALDEALQSLITVERSSLPLQRGTETARVNVKVHPVRDRTTGRTFALIIFEQQNGEHAAQTQETEARVIDERSETQGLEARLHDVEAQLRAAVEQYEVQNEELKASNEELQATNEELRATTEELETGKEELQSINEELTTVNQELKNKVDETTRISDDLQNFISATEIAAMFVDRDMRLMRYTPFARDLFNVIPSDIGRPLLDITHRLETFDFETVLRTVLQTLHVGEYEARTTDGQWYIVRILPYRTTDDAIRGAVIVFIDISERRKAEAVVREAEERGRLVVESVRDYAIVTADEAGRIQTWNIGAQQIFGYTAEEVTGLNLDVLFTREDRDAGVPQNELEQARRTGRANDDRWQMRKDGSRFYASGMTARVGAGDAQGFVKILRDLTDQRRQQDRRDEMLVAESVDRVSAETANRLKDEFLATLSHELRNPLSLILMQTELLLRSPELQKMAKLKRAAEIIHQTTTTQAQLVEDLLDVSRAKTGKLAINQQLLPLPFIVADSIGALKQDAELKQVALEIDISSEALIVEADAVRVKQIAWNLISNAVKFTPMGGRVTVRVGREGNEARLDVEDTGIGIEKEVLPHVFEWFQQADPRAPRRAGGMGIGLALVRQLAELQRGRVAAASEGKDKGSRFTVWLPLHAFAPLLPALPETPAMSGDSQLAGLRLLIVDDSSAGTQSLRDLLELEGAQVDIAGSGAQALALGGQHRYDLIISDIAMPQMDGHAMLQGMHSTKLNAETPAIAYTGYGRAQDLERSLAAGFARHFTKPLDITNLTNAILELTRSRSKSLRKVSPAS